MGKIYRDMLRYAPLQYEHHDDASLVVMGSEMLCSLFIVALPYAEIAQFGTAWGSDLRGVSRFG